MEETRDHVLKAPKEVDEATLLELAERLQSTPDVDPTEGEFTALASEADFEKIVYDGGEFGLQAMAGSDEERDYLGLPGLLEPDQVRDLLQRRQAQHLSRVSQEQPSDATDRQQAQATHQRLRALRKELNSLVGAWHHRTDEPHGVIHNALRSATGGPPSAAADEATLQERIDLIRRWAITGRS